MARDTKSRERESNCLEARPSRIRSFKLGGVLVSRHFPSWSNAVADLGTSPNTMAARDARRSTRISESVRLSVSGESKVGSTFSEATLKLAVNCHGCIYPSRNEHRTGSWVTLEFPNQQSDPKLPPVRAQVRFVRAIQNPNEQFLVGVELEAPANVWRVTSIPKDWLRFPVFAGTAESVPHASTAPAGPGGPDRVALSPDQLLHVLEKHLRQAAEQAVASAGTFPGKPDVHLNLNAIDKVSQASVRQVQKHCVRYPDKMVTLASEEVLRRLQAGLTQAEGRLPH